MRVKKIYLKDTYTHMPVVVLQFEPIDEEFCKKAGFGTDLKIVVRFSGKHAACVSAYKFADEYEPLKEKIVAFEMSGTVNAVGAILDQVDNVQHLPDVLDVEETRRVMNSIEHPHILHKHILEILDDYNNHDTLRKVIYKKDHDWIAIAIINVGTNEMLFETSGNDKKFKVPSYLWIPLEPATADELEPFKERLGYRISEL